MKLSKILNNIIKEGLSREILKNLENDNKTTLPKILSNKIFFHEVPDMGVILKSTKGGNDDLTNNKGDGFVLTTVNVKMIIPTQRSINIDNLKSVSGVGTNGVELAKDNQFYFVIDGHHRIANAILNGETEIDVKVFGGE